MQSTLTLDTHDRGRTCASECECMFFQQACDCHWCRLLTLSGMSHNETFSTSNTQATTQHNTTQQTYRMTHDTRHTTHARHNSHSLHYIIMLLVRNARHNTHLCALPPLDIPRLVVPLKWGYVNAAIKSLHFNKHSLNAY